MHFLADSKWSRYLRFAGLFLLLVAVFGVGFYLRGLGSATTPDADQTKDQKKNDQHKHPITPAKQDTTLWTCSMHPQIRQPEPGNCPICGMKLVAVTSSRGGLRQITLDPETVKLMRLKTSPVERRFVTATVRMVGTVTYDETRLKRITAWVDGRLDRLFVDFTGVPVKKGEHMVLIYSPELYSAQTELLQALKFQKPGENSSTGGVDLVESAREKLRLYGMTPEQIEEIEKRGTPSYQLTINAPIGGIVIEKFRNQGDYVKTGDKIYTIADLSELWVQFDAYESDLHWIRYGQKVEFTTEAYPGMPFEGQVAFIHPVLNDKTRTVKIRVNVRNEDGNLKPEMLARGIVRSNIAAGGHVMDPSLAGKWISPMHPSVVKDEPGKCPICGMALVRAESLGYVPANAGKEVAPLIVPKTAVLITGTRAIVYVQVPDTEAPTFVGREIVLGPRAGDYYLVRSGLQEGDMVVTNGTFKLDADLQIQAKPSMMTPEGGGGGGHDHGDHGAKKDGKKSTPTDKTKIPAKFHKQLTALEKSYVSVSKALSSQNVKQINQSFADFGKALHSVDEKLLEDHPLMVWNELVMLLHNDVVEGHNAEQLSQADKAFQKLKEHMRRLREQFGHDHEERRPTIPPEFRKQLGNVLQAYVPLQKALAADQPKKARQAIPQVQKALASVDGKTLPDGAQPFWQKERAHLEKMLGEMAKTDDLKSMRELFSPLSGGLSAAIRIFGVEKTQQIYEMHCSMAFNNRGASWLQSDEKPRNPYFGADMPACVSRVQLIAGTGTSKQKEGHKHHE